MNIIKLQKIIFQWTERSWDTQTATASEERTENGAVAVSQVLTL